MRDEYFHQARLMGLDAMTSPSASEKLATRLWRRYGAEALPMLDSIRADTGWHDLRPTTSQHFHVVMQIGATRLGHSMRWLSGTYARSFNGRHRRSGHVFGSRYRATYIRDEKHLVEACRYVDLNPVRAGICAHPADWQWSSFRALAGLAPHPPFLSRHAADLVGGDWASFVEQALTGETRRALGG